MSALTEDHRLRQRALEAEEKNRGYQHLLETYMRFNGDTPAGELAKLGAIVAAARPAVMEALANG